MTVIRTYRPWQETPMVPCEVYIRHTPGAWCPYHGFVPPVYTHERVFTDPVLADAWADFMALAGYVVEMEGDRA
jgi:hypothetical protein